MTPFGSHSFGNTEVGSLPVLTFYDSERQIWYRETSLPESDTFDSADPRSAIRLHCQALKKQKEWELCWQLLAVAL